MRVPFEVREDRWLRRYARARAGSAALRATVADWMAEHRRDHGFRRFGRHFDLIERAVSAMLDRVDEDLAAPREPYAEGYEHCRAADTRVAKVRALFRWYADKYDQRADPGTGAILRAADEVALSCWQEAFLAAGRPARSGPLCYLRSPERIDCLQRGWVPRDLGVAAADPLAPFLAELPVPVIGLPESVAGEAWWLAAVAHETGHLVQADLGLGPATRDALAAAVPGPLGGTWAGWHAEVFADAFAVLLLGDALVWAVTESQAGTPARLVEPIPGYPPAAVRTVLLGELIRRLGGTTTAPDVPAAAAWLADLASPDAKDAAACLAAVPAVAEAVLGIQLGDRPLREVADAAVLGGDRRLADWAWLLGEDDPVFGATATRSAVRLLLAAGVSRYDGATADPRLLNSNLVAALAAAGAPGLLADPGPDPADAVADRLADLLFADGEAR
ncbi:hypothetical protein [Actinokineospora sp. NPDC004072]